MRLASASTWMLRSSIPSDIIWPRLDTLENGTLGAVFLRTLTPASSSGILESMTHCFVGLPGMLESSRRVPSALSKSSSKVLTHRSFVPVRGRDCWIPNPYVFSGGKLEMRKAQDLVLLAFRDFSRRHRNAILVTAWHSRWDRSSARFKGKLDAPLELDGNGLANIKQWAIDNGIDPCQILELFSIPNQMMPTILREMNVALQPSRAEACTNLLVKEAMACGLPVIVGSNTGMADLITEDNCVALRNQGPVTIEIAGDTTGWGESNVDEIVDVLEMLYADAQRRKLIGETAARWVSSNRTWQKHATQLKEFILSLD